MRLVIIPLLFAAGCLRPQSGSDDGGQAMMDHSSSSSGTIQPKTTVKPGSCGDGAQDAGESILLAQNRS